MVQDALPVYRLYLNGQWAEPCEMLEVVNPATGEAFARVGTADRSMVRQALADAQQAFGAWRRLAGRERGALLHRIADRLEQRAESIARSITLENGKPLAQARAEVAMSVDHLRWFAGEAPRAYGRIVPQQVASKRHLVVREPIGVVGAIAPWNFPLVLAVRKVAPALAAGCPVILKPARATPLASLALAEAVHEAGLAPGVFQVVVGDADSIVGEFLNSPICRKITFTGSTAVGRQLIRGACQQLPKLSLELGGHAPVLVFEDADLHQAVEGTLVAKFRNTGQSCIAANRVYVHRSIVDQFVARLVERTRSLRIGNGLDEGVEIGPLISQQALEHALNQIEEAVQGGAKVLCGGRRWGTGPGFFLEPTILVDVPDTAQCLHEESFAPLLPVAAFDTEAEAVQRANASRYGLAAYAFTRDISRVWRLAESLEAGTVAINDPVPATSPCPFGGMKQSGWGRELGSEGLDAFLETKHISLGIEP